MLYAKIGRRIRERRRMQKMTQAVLAEQAGISLSFLGHIERGTRKLSVETLCAICKALDCSADQLLETGGRSYGSTACVRDLLQDALVILSE